MLGFMDARTIANTAGQRRHHPARYVRVAVGRVRRTHGQSGRWVSELFSRNARQRGRSSAFIHSMQT
jgi:hypothetical protein